MDAAGSMPFARPGMIGLAELVSGLQRRDPTALSEAIGRFRGVVLKAGRRRGLVAWELEDLEQITWGILLDRAAEIRAPDRLPGWLSRVADREAVRLARLRLDWADDAAVAAEADARATAEVDRIAARLDASRTIEVAVRRLPDTQRRLVLFVLAREEASYQDISVGLGMPIGSIGPIMGRALRTLRRELVRGGLGVAWLASVAQAAGMDAAALAN